VDWRTAGRLLFRLRGVTPVPLALLALGFARVTAASAIGGVTLVVLGEALRFWGVSHVGIASRARTPSPKKLVVGGPYRFVRHPLYAGNFLIGLGFTIAANALFPWLVLGYSGLFALQYGLFVRLEEEELARKFGEEHRAYAARVPAFFPNGARGAGRGGKASLARGLRSEWRSLLAHAGALLLLYVAWRLGD
jgi:protein-S-isoprenylcysteine O-methyltransferase Ste14